MTTATTARPMTADALLKRPDDGFRCELVRGELRKTPFADRLHGICALSIGVSLGLHVETNGLGTTYAAGTDFELASDHVRAERADAASGANGFFPGSPDLAVEVISFDVLYMDVAESNPFLAWREKVKIKATGSLA